MKTLRADFDDLNNDTEAQIMMFLAEMFIFNTELIKGQPALVYIVPKDYQKESQFIYQIQKDKLKNLIID